MLKINRAILIVLDSVGAGAMPDAGDFGDTGANTLGHIAEYMNGLNLPNMQHMGLGNIIPVKGVPPTTIPSASYGIMMEVSKSKDTMAGHWEMMGLTVEKPFPTYPHGFPRELMEKFYKLAGVNHALGNKAASGTEIIVELGEEHIKTGFPIVYTSADSVFQIAAHEGIIPVPRLYQICEAARKVCDEYQIGRVIARPFSGEVGRFTRTANRKDFPMIPPGKTALDVLKENNFPVVGIGKIEDIFAGKGITRAIHTKSNDHGMQCLMEELDITSRGLIFINLVDFDMVYGHRNNAEGYARALETFDRQLGELLPHLKEDDLLIITADHGCDPTFPGTDHTRECPPLLVYSQRLSPRALGTRHTFADIGFSLLDWFGLRASGGPLFEKSGAKTFAN
ncbi:MAG: phosphopentomutase [Acidobacteria bacterium]|nr:phosphopentomutase [Acidobacteriota bacterium]